MEYLTQAYDRQQLYEEVWAEAVTRVAKRYNISDVGLRKVCKKLNIPLPPLGYWAKIQAGKKLPIPALPPYDGPDELVTERGVLPDKPSKPELPEIADCRQFESDPKNHINVPPELDRPHPLVAATQKAFNQAAKEHKRGFQSWDPLRPNVRRIYLYHDTRGIPYLSNKDGLDIAVTEQSRPRALRIMSALLHALDARRLPVHMDREGKKGTYTSVAGEEISIRLTERTTRSEREPTAEEKKKLRRGETLNIYPRFVFHPTNELSLGIVSEYSSTLDRAITDGKTQKIEERLNEFVTSLFREAYDRKQTRHERERERKKYEAAERRRYAREMRRQKELEKLKNLEAEAQQWRRAQDIRAYVLAVESSTCAEGKTIDAGGELGRWITWARERADWLDPLVEANCPGLDAEDDDSSDEASD